MTDEMNQTIEPSNDRSSGLKSLGKFLFELAKIVVVAGITIGLIRYFLFKPFYVKGASMEPNFFNHEYLIIDELTYRMRLPERGEVIVFHYPLDRTQFFLKRVIGLPGERVKVAEGHVYVYNAAHPEGIEVDEKYLPDDLATDGELTVQLGTDQYFVMGDNRPNSYDSRRFGPISKSDIVGRAWFRGWPFNRMEKFNPPTFNF